MLVPQAIQQGFVAATNAVLGATMTVLEGAAPIGSFTDPEYAQVGLTEKQALAAGEIVVAKICFDSTTRTIIDGRTSGFCKLIIDSQTRQILGCHVVGERAVGRPGRVSGTYEKSVSGLPYVLAYCIDTLGGQETIFVLRVIHTARHWPGEAWPD